VRSHSLEADKVDLRAERDRLLGVIEIQAAAQPAARRGWFGRLFGK
jgi:hypothetical protein